MFVAASLPPPRCWRSGKSSLLNVLAGQVPAAKQNRLEGVVVVGETDLSDFDTQVTKIDKCQDTGGCSPHPPPLWGCFLEVWA